MRYCCVACLYVRTIRELVEREWERLENEFERYCELRLSWYVSVSVDAMASMNAPVALEVGEVRMEIE